MRKTLLMTTGLAWLALTGAASAAITVTATPGPDRSAVLRFGQPSFRHNFVVNGDTWSLLSGNAAVEHGPSVQGHICCSSGNGTSTTTFMSVFGGGVEQVVLWTARTSLSIYWGSMTGPWATVLPLRSTAIRCPARICRRCRRAPTTAPTPSPTSNQLITISGLGSFTTATFSSTQEFVRVQPWLAPGVPEPSTWAMMALGFAGLGYAAFRRNTKGRALAI